MIHQMRLSVVVVALSGLGRSLKKVLRSAEKFSETFPLSPLPLCPSADLHRANGALSGPCSRDRLDYLCEEQSAASLLRRKKESAIGHFEGALHSMMGGNS